MLKPGVAAALVVASLMTGVALAAPSVATGATTTSTTAAERESYSGSEASAVDLTRSAVGSSVDTTARATVEAAYLAEWFKPAIENLPEWDGESASCRAGTVRDEYINSWKTRTNFVRGLAGLAPVTYQRSHNSELQQAALVQSTRWTSLSHEPPAGSRCFTPSALTGSSTSNLGYSGDESVADLLLDFMTDLGPENIEAGHRAWNLDPAITSMGIGYVSPHLQYAAQKVIGTTSNAAALKPAWVTWPTAGYFPRDMEPEGRWSISSTDTTLNLLDATVVVSGAEGAHAAHIEYASAGRLTFRPAQNALPQDTPLKVQVSGIRRADGSAAPNYSYEVQFFDPKVYEYTPRAQVARVGQSLDPVPTTQLSRYADGSAVVGSHAVGNVHWYVNGSLADIGETYVPQPENFGKRLTAVVHGTNDRFTISGVAAVVEYGPIGPGTVASSGEVRLDTPYAGLEVSASMSGDWSIEDTTEHFQWFLAGVPIRGATGASIVPAASWANKALQVRVTGTAPHATSATFTSSALTVQLQDPVRAKYFSTRVKIKRAKKYVKVTGNLRLAWNLKPTSVRYQWYVNGKLTKTTAKPSSSIKITRRGKSVVKLKVTARLTNHRDFVTTRKIGTVKR